MPSGPANLAPKAPLVINGMVFRHTKYPNAAKEYLRFMMEADQYEPWLNGCLGYWGHPLKAYDQRRGLGEAIRRYTSSATSQDREFWTGYKGPISAASGAVAANYVTVHMFAAVASGQATPGGRGAGSRAAGQAVLQDG